MAKKRFFSMRPPLEGLRAAPGWKRALRQPRTRLGAAILLVLVLTIFLSPLLVPYGYSQIITVDGQRDRGAKNLAPFEYSQMEREAIARGETIFPHIFGTDELCRDYFVRVMYGARVSLLTGVLATLVVLVIGTAYGAVAGYAGGKADLWMMRLVDLIYALPDTLMVILFSVVLDQTLMERTRGHGAGEAGQQPFVPVHRLRGAVLGGHGAAGARARALPEDGRLRAGRAGGWARARGAYCASTYCPAAPR